MTAYLARRVGTSIVILIGISIFIFVLLHAVFPSPAIVVLGPRASPVAVSAWNAANGFDAPVIVQYWHYLIGVLHGNLGYSYKLNQSVAALFGERWARSAYLSGAGLVLAVLIAIPLGIYQAVKRNSVGDNVATGLAFMAYAMPDFLLYLIAVQVFALTFHIFGFEASQSNSIISIIGDWHDMTLPIVCLALLILAGYSRYMRSAAMDILAQDYIKTARAKGLPERLVLLRHLVRNACLPMVTLVGLSIPALLAGNLIAESVFNFDGLGLLFFDSLQNEDYPVLLAYTLVGAVLTVLGNLLADIALTIADPRIRLS
ncbi:MAG TPA: ABC transporter permease [Streptosporangiaceae bacterium]|nr:ABC transporter permease [Streptosporangiaceae bacterium]